MDKCRMTSRDLVQDNIDAIARLFPNCVTEAPADNPPKVDADGRIIVERKIDFEKLKQELSRSVIEGRTERYEFNWPGKRAAALLANTPIEATLRPCREESVNFDTTENLYIEGDNLDVLKLLCDNYRGKVKMIYIDPPYNTGHDFVYEDDFAQRGEEYRSISGDYDDLGNRLSKNTTASGRFHTDWLNMMYPRLQIAQKLLKDDGVIFISIDDSEQANLKKICDEVFGSQNFIAQLVWERAYAPKNDARFVSNSHDYVFMYCKKIDCFVIGRLPRTEEANARYSNPDNDPRGVWKPSDLSVKTYNAESDYPITTPSGRVVEPPAGRCWSLSKKAFFERLQDNRIWFGDKGDSVPCMKRFLSELKFDGMAPTSILFYKEVGHSQEGAKEVTALLEAGAFDGPKPIRLLRRLLTLANLKTDSLILDFFSGSATTAHAVMQLNAEDGGHRKFIMVQIPEACEEGSEAAKAGYSNICEIGKERIRRAGNNIKTTLKNEIERAQKRIEDIDKQLTELEEKAKAKSKEAQIPGLECENLDEKSQEKRQQLLQEKDELASKIEEKSSILDKLDIGFRVLKLDSSNMEDVFYRPSDLKQENLPGLADNVKPDRTAEDLLFQVMLEKDIPLSSKIETEEIEGKTIFNVADGFLLACFDIGVTDKVVTAIAKKQPVHAVFRDAGMATDSTAINFEQIFATYSPDTRRSII